MNNYSKDLRDKAFALEQEAALLRKSADEIDRLKLVERNFKIAEKRKAEQEEAKEAFPDRERITRELKDLCSDFFEKHNYGLELSIGENKISFVERVWAVGDTQWTLCINIPESLDLTWAVEQIESIIDDDPMIQLGRLIKLIDRNSFGDRDGLNDRYGFPRNSY